MTHQHEIVVRPVGDKIRITSLKAPRFCVEADTREEAIKLAQEAFQYMDSVSHIKYEPSYEVELLCA